jgi:hypothetical protein
MATTKGLAVAEVLAFVALSSWGELYGTIIPRKNTKMT